MRNLLISAVMLLATPPAPAAPVPASLAADPAPDGAHPAGMSAFVLPVGDGALNAAMYTAAGAGPHPTLLLLHGFPGNEQNLDLAQAARRAGWNVLTFHYRGSWGSPGGFSFTHAAQDAHAALAFLRDPATVARYGVDPARIAVAGHSMGGFMAADTAADDPKVIGLALVDPWNIAGTASALSTPQGMAAWKAEADGDLPPLAGTSFAALTQEMREGGTRFDLSARAVAYGRRPLLLIGATRGISEGAKAAAQSARAAGNSAAQVEIMPTDHSFSDHRIALATRLVDWLASLSPIP